MGKNNLKSILKTIGAANALETCWISNLGELISFVEAQRCVWDLFKIKNIWAKAIAEIRNLLAENWKTDMLIMNLPQVTLRHLEAGWIKSIDELIKYCEIKWVRKLLTYNWFTREYTKEIISLFVSKWRSDLIDLEFLWLDVNTRVILHLSKINTLAQLISKYKSDGILNTPRIKDIWQDNIDKLWDIVKLYWNK